VPTKNDKEYAEREQRIVQYIKDEFTQEDIGKLESLDASYAGRLRRETAKKYGLDIKYGHSQVKLDKHSPSFRMRFRLGSILNLLDVVKKMTPIQIAVSTGVSRKLLRTRIIESPNSYDWKLSELEKVAKTINVPFHDLIAGLISEEEPEWLTIFK
jgi:hypothetical protein